MNCTDEVAVVGGLSVTDNYEEIEPPPNAEQSLQNIIGGLIIQ